MKPDLFNSIISQYNRREIIRWIIHDNNTANQNITDIINKGLQDSDWEVRISSIIACARMNIQSLLSEVINVEIPDNGKSGLNKEELKIIQGIKEASIYLLRGGKIGALYNKVPKTKEEKTNYLLHCVKGNPVKHLNQVLLLLVALVDPMYPTSKQKLPSVIEEREKKWYLKNSGIEVCYVPDMTHFIGSNEVSYHPIRVTKVDKGLLMPTKS